ncbi:galectin-1-like isoform X2 [Dromiciops gliroides]|uniref:galectin-1-like isoform X2 n=1 Tax=Dromiciops gliroides TaxID=33562 RepID=UPI001CC36BEB|nr:galectin-1-like isoform X2 [Dromiciops gliroides]XP_043824450.1 galectin-1-like isoform X2 [Dromiciops gliroides]XP_043824451.1 galectin-1-like isoform X2 [Dromiciops gliroides]
MDETQMNPGFSIQMGKDGRNLDMHLSIRFKHGHDLHKIVWNTKENGKWGEEQRDSHFPFIGKTMVEISILFEEDSFTVTLLDGHKLKFPNRTKATKLDYLGTAGDIYVTKLAFA